MGDIADEHHGEDFPVSGYYVRNKRNIEIGEDLFEDIRSRTHVARTEEYPAETYEMECHEDTGDAPSSFHIRTGGFHPGKEPHQKLMQCEQQAVETAPQDESRRRTVPQPPEQHGDDEVHISAEPAFPVAAERDIEIILEPRRERDVPAPPELRYRGRLVRRIEVFGNRKPSSSAMPMAMSE